MQLVYLCVTQPFVFLYLYLHFYWAGFTVAQRERAQEDFNVPYEGAPTSPTPHLHTKDSIRKTATAPGSPYLMFRYSHATMPLGQPERAYDLTYFINRFSIHLFQKTSERTANGSCRTEIAQPKGTVVSIFGMQKQ